MFYFLGYEDDIYFALRNGSLKNSHYRVIKKQDFPEKWHYKHNKRSPPILVLADKGYALDDLIIAAPMYAEKYNFTRKFHFALQKMFLKS